MHAQRVAQKAKIEEIKQFCIEKTQDIIVELQGKRFDNQGAFNDNERWMDNAPDVVADKGRNEPLVDTGELKESLMTSFFWNLNPVSSKNKLLLTIPEEENFTESKYDDLQTGGKSGSYTSVRGRKMKARDLPARNFKKLSKADADWIVKRLVEEITKKFGS